MLLKAAESASSGRNARPVTQYTSTSFSPQKMANIATVRTASPHTSLISFRESVLNRIVPKRSKGAGSVMRAVTGWAARSR
jgi:hypothetical protein